MREMRNVYKIMVGKPEGKGPLLVVDNKVVLEWVYKYRWEGRDWIHLA
jgi:hypothetical protein